jgi:hypothetical protein
MFVLLILLHYPGMNSIYQLYNAMNRKTAEIQSYVRFLYFYINCSMWQSLRSTPVRSLKIPRIQLYLFLLVLLLKPRYHTRNCIHTTILRSTISLLVLSMNNSAGWLKRRRLVLYLSSARIIFTVFTSRSS